MDREYETTLAIAEQAADWLERLSTASTAERESFVAWLRQSPVHVREFLLAIRCVEQLRHLDSLRLLDVELFTDQARQNVAPMTAVAAVHLPISSTRREQPAPIHARRKLGWKLAAAGAFLAVLSAAIVGLLASSAHAIRTAAGEWHTTQLPDGTILRAGPRTQATFDFSEKARIVRLAKGELMLHVAKEQEREFSVVTDLAVAQALGTAFAVQHRDHRVLITVKEGSVSVQRRPVALDRTSKPMGAEAVTVTAAQQVEVTTSRLPLTVAQVDPDREFAWTAGKLILNNKTVADAVHEFNLRNKIQIKLLSPALATRQVRGVMNLGDPESFTQWLEQNGDVSLETDEDGTLLLLPQPSPTKTPSGDRVER